MKVGRDRTPLSERLNDQVTNPVKGQQNGQINHQADQVADLMRLTLESFKNDCADLSKSAKHTIESDIASLVQSIEREMKLTEIKMKDQVAQLQKGLQPIFITSLLISLIIIVMSFTASWYWASHMINKAQSASLWQMGLIQHQTETETLIIWDQKKAHLSQCLIRGTSIPCLRLLEVQ